METMHASPVALTPCTALAPHTHRTRAHVEESFLGHLLCADDIITDVISYVVEGSVVKTELHLPMSAARKGWGGRAKN